MGHRNHNESGPDLTLNQEREMHHREAQQDQSGRIRHYLDLAERLLDDERERYPDGGSPN